MKKSLISFSLALSIAAFGAVAFIPVIAQAQTVPGCPVGDICVPIGQQPVGCPVGDICTPINPGSSGGGYGGYYGSGNGYTGSGYGGNGNCYTFTRDLSLGSTGADVIALQNWLIANDYNIPAISSGAAAKGYYGSATVSAVRMFQAVVGLPITGIVDAQTRAKLNASCTTTQPASGNQPSITVTSTTGGQSVGLDGGLPISWTENNFSPKDIRVYLNSSHLPNGASVTLASLGSSRQDSLNSEVPGFAGAGNDYTVSVCDDGTPNPNAPGKSLCGNSQPFTVDPSLTQVPAQPPIVITSVQYSPTSPQVNQFANATVTVWNEGSTNQTTLFEVDVNGTTASVPSLAAGAQTTVTIPNAVSFVTAGVQQVPVSTIFPIIGYPGSGDTGVLFTNTLTFTSSANPGCTYNCGTPVANPTSSSPWYSSQPANPNSIQGQLQAQGETWTKISGTITTGAYVQDILEGRLDQPQGRGAIGKVLYTFSNGQPVAMVDFGNGYSVGINESELSLVSVSACTTNCNAVSSSNSVSASVISASDNQAGTWGVFGPGNGQGNYSGGIQGQPNDWTWNVTVNLATPETISYMEISHSGTNQIWSTRNSSNYPLVVYPNSGKGGILNTYYGQTLGSYQAGSHSFVLYGQIDNINYPGDTITVGFTDGTSVTGSIPATTIRPTMNGGGTTTQVPSITVTYPQAGNSLDNSGAKNSGLIANVQWSSLNTNNLPIEVDLMNSSGVIVKNIATYLPNTGSYAWKYDSTIPNGTYQILVSTQAKVGTLGDAAGQSGYFTLTGNSGTQQSLTTTVPILTSINPPHALPGASMSLTGTNISSTVSHNLFIYDANGTFVGNVNNLTPNFTGGISFIVPSVSAGNYSVSDLVSGQSAQSNRVSFTVDAPTTSAGLKPTITSGPLETNPSIMTQSSVAVYGTNFTPTGNNVMIDGTVVSANASPAYGGSNMIMFTLPATLSVGTHSVTVSNGNGTSNAVTFKVDPAPVAPSIVSISPLSGPLGTQVTIYGTGFTTGTGSFAAGGNGNDVYFKMDNDHMFSVNGVTPIHNGDTLVFTLPTTYSETPGTYQVYIQNANGNDYANAKSFTITAPTSYDGTPNTASGADAVRQLCAATHWPGCTGL